MHNSAIVAVWSQALTALLARMTAQTRRKERYIKKTLQFFNGILTRQSKRTEVSSSIHHSQAVISHQNSIIMTLE